MMSPQFVKPYRKSDKNDRNDAEAICEAVTRPSMRFVAVKSIEQQDMLTLHRVREGLMKERIALINRIRGSLSEYGSVIAKNVSNLRRELPRILEDAENGLTTIARQIFNELYEDLGAREERIAQIERSIRALGSQHEVVHRLETAPGIGYLSATALFATVGDAKQYKNGRQLAASIGAAVDAARADCRLAVNVSGNTRRWTRSTKAGGVSPSGRRVHCTRLNDSGMSAATSVVASKHTGTTNTRLRAIMWVR
jgi:transposase